MIDNDIYSKKSYMTAEETRLNNSRIVRTLSVFLNLSPDAVKPETVKELSETCGISRENAYAECLAVICGIDASGRDKAFFRNYIVPMIRELDVSTYENDEYYRTVKIPSLSRGHWELKTQKLSACEAFVRDDFTVDENLRMLPQIGFFSEEFSYPAVLENGREWMTLMPNETVTTLPAVKEAFGNVLTYGLGLGYFAFMTSQKENVKSVTVVELSKDVVSLFEEFILPQFPHKEKIKLICADAFDFVGHNAVNGGYDYIFADIWHDVGDGKDMYLKMKSYEPLNPGAKYAYWLEKTIKCYLDRRLWP